jgi:hypothetical protein
MKGGYAGLGFQRINFIVNDSNQLNKFWISCSSINQKGTYVKLEPTTSTQCIQFK